MSDAIITVENLSKRYTIGHRSDQHDGLRHAVENAFRSPLRWLRARAAHKRAEREDFWALRDVSFEVMQGEVVGIIGRNGAGKVHAAENPQPDHRADRRAASRCTAASPACWKSAPAFIPELTGRENIFLNGAILGMRSARSRASSTRSSRSPKSRSFSTRR